MDQLQFLGNHHVNSECGSTPDEITLSKSTNPFSEYGSTQFHKTNPFFNDTFYDGQVLENNPFFNDLNDTSFYKGPRTSNTNFYATGPAQNFNDGHYQPKFGDFENCGSQHNNDDLQGQIFNFEVNENFQVDPIFNEKHFINMQTSNNPFLEDILQLNENNLEHFQGRTPLHMVTPTHLINNENFCRMQGYNDNNNYEDYK